MTVYIKNNPSVPGVLRELSTSYSYFSTCEKTTHLYRFNIEGHEAEAYIYKGDHSQFSVNCPKLSFEKGGKEKLTKFLKEQGFSIVEYGPYNFEDDLTLWERLVRFLKSFGNGNSGKVRNRRTA